MELGQIQRSIKSVAVCMLLSLQCGGWQTGGACGAGAGAGSSSDNYYCDNCVCRPGATRLLLGTVQGVYRSGLEDWITVLVSDEVGVFAGGPYAGTTIDVRYEWRVQMLESLSYSNVSFGWGIILYYDDVSPVETPIDYAEVESDGTIYCEGTGKSVAAQDAVNAALQSNCVELLEAQGFEQPSSVNSYCD